jgi:heptosyltransferase-1
VSPASDVLVIRPSSLGDVVHALPIVADIAQARPGTAIDWIAEEAFAPLVRLNPGVRRVIEVSLRRWRRQLLERAAWTEFGAFRRELRTHAYAAVLDLQEQLKGALIARLARGMRHGFDRASVREPVSTLLHDRHHAVSTAIHFQDRCRVLAAQALGYAVTGPARFGLVTPPAPAGLLPPRSYAVCVHATSRDDKLWPDTHWRTVIAALETAGRDVVLPWGSPQERARSEALARGHAHAVVPERRPLPVVASLLRSAEIVIGVDTGLVHLAAALGTPSVALFTVTDPALAGIAIAGPHALDLGGCGVVPAPDAVLTAVSTLTRNAPRC